MTNRYDAANQFASRPADESFGTLPAFLAHLRTEKQISRETTKAIKDLRANPHANGGIVLTSTGADGKERSASLTHWAFGQMARTISAPAGYLRTLPADITAAAVNYGISKASRQDLKILAKKGGPDDPTIIRAITSPTYARVWSADLYADLAEHLTPRGFDLPPVWPGLDTHGTGKAGAYAGDRDAYLILALPESSIVNDPTARRSRVPLPNGSPTHDDGAMFPAIIVKNSDVGASSVTLELIYIRYICGNHILWGVETGSRFKRRHVGTNAQRDSVREILRITAAVGAQNPADIERMIKTLAEREIANTEDGVIEELRALGISEADAKAAYTATAAEQTNTTASPRSYWGIVQGLTYTSQHTGYQDDRFSLDQMAAKVLTKGRELVAA